MQLLFGKTLNPIDYPSAEIVKVPFEDLGTRTKRLRRTRWWLAHALAPPRYVPTLFGTTSPLISGTEPDRLRIFLLHPRPNAADSFGRDVNDVAGWRAVHRREFDARTDVDLRQPLQKFRCTTLNNSMGMTNYLIVYGHARLVEGGDMSESARSKGLTDFIGEGHHEREYKQATTVFH